MVCPPYRTLWHFKNKNEDYPNSAMQWPPRYIKWKKASWGNVYTKKGLQRAIVINVK